MLALQAQALSKSNLAKTVALFAAVFLFTIKFSLTIDLMVVFQAKSEPIVRLSSKKMKNFFVIKNVIAIL
jgi:hypothetical protein